ncbi:MAG: enoyl-CoA hydratase [Gemmatimonadetes bacterium SCN 70-22]|nr:MAG: enoyl-CoA hydratase [Gemmatimonadetes bacterium SCN 70-22]
MTMPMATLQVGQTAEFSKTVTESDVTLFAGITGDFNPAHVDEVRASASRFGGRIAHGMLSAGFISACIAMRLPGPGAIYLSQTLKFTRPVRIGDTVTARVEVLEWNEGKRRARLLTTCRNQRGELVIEGEALVLVPDEAAGDGR